ncbi:MAG: enoyl-CoA hydratase-related protein [Candidatus Marinimicrobia bacterium]|jgi:methylglutaconyl-CoA hydratase|nr:enoyl-CoA hydratase-related protein [Candidatus Neomarinimicrobiota bacterium]MDP6789744.1 enoyl-CoA hydratase-related protein [Candidatus Neomarinimicrobiota bacterium]MDP7071653.1 enoyl-CoA hydratase-related protein [Candidatus Neomarinimicrobiota bacterium]
MADYTTIQFTQDDGLAHVELNRPDVRNALSTDMIREITDVFTAASSEDSIRIILLSGSGESFCAGADLQSMKDAGTQSFEENKADAELLEAMYTAVNNCDKPVVGKIHGHAFGGGFGLCTVCDIVVADAATIFSLSEVLLGIIPSVIGPFTVDKIGMSHFRALGISGERFDGAHAEKIGLVHFSVAEEDLNQTVDAVIKQLKKAGPKAMAGFKSYCRSMELEDAAALIAELRASEEGQEGISAFLEKRKPNWK